MRDSIRSEEVQVLVAAPPPFLDDASFDRRRHANGMRLDEVTLPHESVTLLCDICTAYGTDPIFRAHSPSLTAAEKSRIVAPARVQKTVTVRFDDVAVLCTALGDPLLARPMLRALASRLGLPRSAAKKLHINPREIDPLACFEMAPGMVSPFLRPGRSTPIRAVALVESEDACEAERGFVAVSLSLRWSLLIAASHFSAILREYAARAYPQVQWIDLRGARDYEDDVARYAELA
ncbi:hypothetical protein LJR230_005017 [Trinickia sp. LjRoot230]|uniref:hypothetical protein n=1 Tax=Trinickia sp. LjRoot230 TaxID=3342288 RepID=UPI003ECEAC42